MATKQPRRSKRAHHANPRTRRAASDDAYNAAANYLSTPTLTSRRLSLPDTLHNLYALDHHNTSHGHSFKVGYASFDEWNE